MLSQALFLFVNVLLLIQINAVSLPTKCNVNDSACVTKSAQAYVKTFAAGIPEIGLETSDPMFIKYVDASSNILKLILKDMTITGLQNTKVKQISYDESKKSITLKLLCTIKLDGKYTMDGNLLFLSLKGNGDLHVNMPLMEITVHADVKELTGKDGKTHWFYEHKSHSYKLKEKSDVVFENLFSENEILATAAKEVIAQSGNEIIVEVGTKAIDAVVVKVFVNVNDFLGAIELNDLRQA